MPVLNIPQVAKRLDSVTFPLTIADPRRHDAPLIYVNPAFCDLYGYTPNQVLGQNCRFLQGTLENDAARKTIRDALTTGTSAQAAFNNLTKDGTPITTLLFMEPLHDRDGNLAYVVGSQFELRHGVTVADVDARSAKVNTEVSGLLKINEDLRYTTRKTLAWSTLATVRLWMDG